MQLSETINPISITIVLRLGSSNSAFHALDTEKLL
jgi:hypothetical protein